MQVYTMTVVDANDHIETSVAGSSEEALEWGKSEIRDVYGGIPVSNYEEENIADREEGGFHVKEKDGSLVIRCQSHEV